MYLFIIIFRLTLVLKVFLYHLFIRILSHRVDIVATCPEFPAPKMLLDLWMKPEYLLCRYTLHGSNNLIWSVRWHALYQKMRMITIKTDFQKMDLIPLLYTQANISQSTRNIIIKHISPIFYRTHKMIQEQALVMAPVDMFTHIHKNITSRNTRGRASGNSND